jgi:hypothetical protein
MSRRWMLGLRVSSQHKREKDMTTSYLEFDTNLQVAACEEYLGREYARDAGSEYPIPPFQWIGPPAEPPPEAWTYYYVRATMKSGAGGVIKLDDEIVRFATQPRTLSNGQEYSLDLQAQAKSLEQLSDAGRAAVAPPAPGGMPFG